MSKSSVGSLAIFLSLGWALAACSHPVEVQITDASNGSDVADFGQVALGSVGTKTLQVMNTGGQEASLGAFSTMTLGLTAPFTLTGGTCLDTPTVTLAPAAQCTFIVQFTPITVAHFQNSLILSFTYKGKAKTAQATIQGDGFLDCTAGPELQTGYGKGVTAGDLQNQQDAAQGTADGVALTYEKGVSDSYTTAYNQAYKSSYDSAYNPAYSRGDIIGYYVGDNDVISCSNGSFAGYSDGSSDGFSDGSYSGYQDGYSDGYSNGDSDGYDSGYSAGANSCNSSDIAPKRATAPKRAQVTKPKAAATPSAGTNAGTDPLTDPANIQACFNQGYANTYSSNFYWNAYNAAEAKNPKYQKGLSDGAAQGTHDGSVDGQSNGDRDGYNDGEAAGIADGEAQAYSDCYASSYNNSYNSAWSNGYYSSSEGYDAGYSDGYDDGDSDGYNSGYDDGQSNYCSNSNAATAKAATSSLTTPTKKYGQGQSWAKVINGKTVSVYTPSKIAIHTTWDAELKSQLDESRKSAMDTVRAGRKGLLLKAITSSPRKASRSQ